MNDTVMSGLETKGMQNMGWSILVPKNAPPKSLLMELPPQQVFCKIDYGADSNYIDFPGLSVAAVTMGHHMLVIAGKCTYSRDDHKHFGIMLRTKKEGKQQGLGSNGGMSWPAVEAFATCPVCETKHAPHSNNNNNREKKKQYWLVFHPLMQVRSQHGAAPIYGSRTFPQLACVSCMEKKMKNLRVNFAGDGVPLVEALREMPGMPLFLKDGYNKDGRRIRAAWELFMELDGAGVHGAFNNTFGSTLGEKMGGFSSDNPLANANDTCCLSCKKEGAENICSKCKNAVCKCPGAVRYCYVLADQTAYAHSG